MPRSGPRIAHRSCHRMHSSEREGHPRHKPTCVYSGHAHYTAGSCAVATHVEFLTASMPMRRTSAKGFLPRNTPAEMRLKPRCRMLWVWASSMESAYLIKSDGTRQPFGCGTHSRRARNTREDVRGVKQAVTFLFSSFEVRKPWANLSR